MRSSSYEGTYRSWEEETPSPMLGVPIRRPCHHIMGEAMGTAFISAFEKKTCIVTCTAANREKTLASAIPYNLYDLYIDVSYYPLYNKQIFSKQLNQIRSNSLLRNENTASLQ